MLVALDCPHCQRKCQTRQVVAPGVKVRCPTCRLVFQLLADHVGLVETIPVVSESPPTMKNKTTLPPRSSDAIPVPGHSRPAVSVTEETPPHRSGTASMTPFLPARKTSTARRFAPFERSRGTIAVVAVMTIAAGVAVFGYWWVKQVFFTTQRSFDVGEERAIALDEFGKGMTKAKPKPAPEQPTTEEADAVTAPRPMRLGDTHLTVVDASVGPVKINGAESTENYLRVTIKISNRSDKPLAVVGWHLARAKLEISDPLGAIYDPIKFPESGLPAGCLQRTEIPPAESRTDLMVFESPKYLMIPDLELKFTFGSSSPRRFRIPGRTIKPAPPPPFPGPTMQQPRVPQQLMPRQAEQTPVPKAQTKEERIRDDARSRWSAIVRAANGQPINNRSDYKRTRRQKLIDELCEENHIDRPALKKIVPQLFPPYSGFPR